MPDGSRLMRITDEGHALPPADRPHLSHCDHSTGKRTAKLDEPVIEINAASNTQDALNISRGPNQGRSSKRTNVATQQYGKNIGKNGDHVDIPG